MGRMMELMRELWRVVVGKLDWMLLDASGHIQIFGKKGYNVGLWHRLYMLVLLLG